MSQFAKSLDFLKSISDATTELVQRLSGSVVSVEANMFKGSGVVLDDQGYIVTCNHVLQDCDNVQVGHGGNVFAARIVGTDLYNDVALLKVTGVTFEAVDFGNSDEVKTGQFVLALANPFNRTQPNATTGIVTNPVSFLKGSNEFLIEDVIATDAKFNHGFSGGPLVDAEGKIIGINNGFVWSRGIALPINRVKTICDRLLIGKKIKKGYVGLFANTVLIPLEVQDNLGIDQQTGIMVFQVEPNSPARKAGLRMGDVIISFNNRPVADFYDIAHLLADDVVDKIVSMLVIREEKLFEFTIKPIVWVGENID